MYKYTHGCANMHVSPGVEGEKYGLPGTNCYFYLIGIIGWGILFCIT